MKKYILSLTGTFLFSFMSAQVGIGTTTPSSAAMLEVSGTTNGVAPYKGFMPPRVPTNVQRDAIPTTSADVGLMVFVMSSGCLQLWDGDSWEDVNCYTIPPVPNQPWINEFHYDNNGADVGEGVEIAGPAGLDLSDYRITLYNGAGGASYGTINLSGLVDDEGSGYGALWFNAGGSIQNGSPDGLALHQISTGTVIQFISYEGSFIATSGVANGSTSDDIGQAEGSGTAVGESLQLTGSGNRYTDFNWIAPAANSQGSLNVGQIIL